MGFPSVVMLAIGLGMDAFSVAIGVGASIRTISFGPVFRLSFHFGLFQLLMPVAGWFAGKTVTDFIAGYDHWVAFGLLTYVGGKMIRESFDEEPKVHTSDPTKGMTLLILSIATSIDALAVGLSFAFLKIPILYPCIIIGIVAFLMTMLGVMFGEKLGRVAGRKVEIFGGIILIGIGIKILIEHML
jgi:putative Mn2+ efflux pump MntP